MRTTLSLNGSWDLAESPNGDQIPSTFLAQVPVPGLVDLARPRLAKVGMLRHSYYWYRRSFDVPEAVRDRATLRIGKARYGAHVWLNGIPVGVHYGCFTGGTFDVAKYIRSGANELVVRVGTPPTLPPWVPWGQDYEKSRYIPGIYDDVTLTLSGTPHIANVQVAPRLQAGAAEIEVSVVNQSRVGQTVPVAVTIRPVQGTDVAGRATATVQLEPGATRNVRLLVPVETVHLWSPEDPFLYSAVCSTEADAVTVRFGMREFRYDAATRRAYLNGAPYRLRGSNITLYRFFEDHQRGTLPWDHAWVRRLLAEIPKSLHLNSFRFCIGIAPRFWYDIADEAGLLIQDEFPIWGYDHQWSTNEIIREFTEWLEESWNHPSIVTWDACNETHSGVLGTKVIPVVRRLDLSNRPWDNGYDAPAGPDDPVEDHPYKFLSSSFDLAHLADDPGTQSPNSGAARDRAVVINEYDWLWLQRDGSPTTLSDRVYRRLLGEKAADPDACRDLYAYLMAVLTEFWRARRQAAAVQYFCYLGYSRPDGETSDNFVDLQNLRLEPRFQERMADAMAPFGVCLDFFASTLPGGRNHDLTVQVINDRQDAQRGALALQLVQGEQILDSVEQRVEVDADAVGRYTLTLAVPAQTGSCELVATLRPATDPGRVVRSIRRVVVS